MGRTYDTAGNVPFHPVKGTESEIFNNYEPTEGYVYFALDTKRIFYGDEKNNQFLPMGGNSGIYFGQKEVSSGDTIVEFVEATDLTHEKPGEVLKLNKNDLILNAGAFYKVLEGLTINEQLIYRTEKLTIAGTGGGTGGGGGSSSTGEVWVEIKPIVRTALVGTDAPYILPFEFGAIWNGSQLTSTNSRARATVKISLLGLSNTTTGFVETSNNTITLIDVPVGSHTVDIHSILPNVENRTSYWIRVFISMDIAGGITNEDRISLMVTPAGGGWSALESATHLIIPSNYSWNIEYQLVGLNLWNRVELYIDGKLIYEQTEYKQHTTNTNTFNLTIPSSDLIGNHVDHGIYTINFKIYANTLNTYDNEVLIRDIYGTGLFYNTDNPEYLIGTSFITKELQQYDSVIIPLLIYGKDNSNGVKVTCADSSKTDTIVVTEKAINNVWFEYYYYPELEGSVTLIFSIADHIVSDLVLNFEVKPFSVSDIGKEVTNFAYKFTPKSYSTNSFLENSDEFELSDNYDLEDQYNGLQSETVFKNERPVVQRYLNIRAGTTIGFKKCKPFSSVDEAHQLESIPAAGRSFKIIFKPTYCESYSAKVGFFKLDNENSVTNSYLNINAQHTNYSFAGLSGTVEYKEEELIELEVDIIGKEPNSISGLGRQTFYIVCWLNGTPYSITAYTNPENADLYIDGYLTLGSEECDIQLYEIKYYNRSLTDREHLQNFIADSLNIVDLQDRMNRNDILIEGETDLRRISIPQLIERNPECVVHAYEIPFLPYTKMKGEGTAPDCVYRQYKKGFSELNEPYVWHNKCKLAVQGTSALNYILGAANLEIDYAYNKADNNNLFHYARRISTGSADNVYIKVDDYGNPIVSDGYSITPNAIPVDYFNIKVNMASAENINNALLQEEYQNLNPYKSAVMKEQDINSIKFTDPITKNERVGKYRDTMEFTNGLLFLIDKNTNLLDSDVENDHKNVFCEDEKYKEKIFKNKNTETGVLKDTFIDFGNLTESQQHEKDNDPDYIFNHSFQIAPEFYAICNFGNSKKNKKVIHRPDEICMSVEDNPFSFTMMTEKLPDSLRTVDDAKTYFDFRQEPKFSGEDSAKVLAICEREGFTPREGYTAFDYWLDFNDWMVDMNPHNATNHYLNKPTSGNTAQYSLEAEAAAANNEQFTGSEESGAGWTFPPFSFSEEKSPWLHSLGITIKDFQGPYTKDTLEYRIAKMLYQCEDHLAMDSLIYHYLFIEKHTMIDNTVKNTFWSSNCSSGYQIWDLCKDYDNDTASGNDNNGELTIEYGQEKLDAKSFNIEEDDLETQETEGYAGRGNTLFNNAFGCCWYRFICELTEALEPAYQDLSKKTRWANPTEYLNKCKAWQDSIPEIIWILDAYRKYRRPDELYSQGARLKQLQGGKKTLQRQAFEEYHTRYLNSKYGVGETSQSSIMFRCNFSDEDANFIIPCKLYQKGYIQYALGNSKIISSEAGDILSNYGYEEGSKRQAKIRIKDINSYAFLTNFANVHGNEILFNIYHPEMYKEIGYETSTGIIYDKIQKKYREAKYVQEMKKFTEEQLAALDFVQETSVDAENNSVLLYWTGVTEENKTTEITSYPVYIKTIENDESTAIQEMKEVDGETLPLYWIDVTDENKTSEESNYPVFSKLSLKNQPLYWTGLTNDNKTTKITKYPVYKTENNNYIHETKNISGQQIPLYWDIDEINIENKKTTDISTYPVFNSEAYQDNISSKASGSLLSLDVLQCDWSQATKLSSLILGNTYDVLNNKYCTKATDIGFSTLSNKKQIIKKLYAKNYMPENAGRRWNKFDFSLLTRLKDLNLEGNSFGAITIADNAPLEQLTLHEPTDINLTNLHFLSKDKIIYNSLDKVKSLNTSNLIPLKKIDATQTDISYVLFKEILKTVYNTDGKEPFDRFDLQKINWKIKTTDQIGDYSFNDSNNPIIKISTDINDKKIYEILFLEELLNNKSNNERIPNFQYLREGVNIAPYNFLSGLITFDVGNLNLSEMEIGKESEAAYYLYNKYVLGIDEDGTKNRQEANKYFHNLDFVFNEANLYHFIIKDGNGNDLWKRAIYDGLTSFDSTFFNDGICENKIQAFNINKINKAETPQYIYEWNGTWTITIGDSVNQNIPAETLEALLIKINELRQTQSGNIICQPEFTEITKTFDITIKVSYSNSELLNLGDSINEYEKIITDVPFGEKLINVLNYACKLEAINNARNEATVNNIELPSYINNITPEPPYKITNNQSTTNIWLWNGKASRIAGGNALDAEYTIIKDETVYLLFEEYSITDPNNVDIFHEYFKDYFTISNRTVTLKKPNLFGKIVVTLDMSSLPTLSITNPLVLIKNNTSSWSRVSHVFFNSNHFPKEYVNLGAELFKSNTNLEWFDFNYFKVINTVYTDAFYENKLKNTQLCSINNYELRSFYRCFDDSVTELTLVDFKTEQTRVFTLPQTNNTLTTIKFKRLPRLSNSHRIKVFTTSNYDVTQLIATNIDTIIYQTTQEQNQDIDNILKSIVNSSIENLTVSNVSSLE